MRPPRIRIRLRWMIILVAIVALVIWGEKMRRLRVSYLARAAAYKRDAALWLHSANLHKLELSHVEAELEEYESSAADTSADPMARRNWVELSRNERAELSSCQADLAVCERYYNEATRLKLKFERPARQPWISISLDPLPPL